MNRIKDRNDLNAEKIDIKINERLKIFNERSEQWKTSIKGSEYRKKTELLNDISNEFLNISEMLIEYHE